MTSVVGMAPSGTAGTTTGTAAARTTTTNLSRNSYGESDQAITIPSTPPSAVDAAAAPAAEAVAKSFLEQFWAPGAHTGAQMGAAVAPFATDRLLAVYRDPALADKAIPGAGVSSITVQTTAATPANATVVGRGNLTETPDKPVYRTLTLVVGPDGVWRVDVVK